jgi:hypothetical protein
MYPVHRFTSSMSAAPLPPGVAYFDILSLPDANAVTSHVGRY